MIEIEGVVENFDIKVPVKFSNGINILADSGEVLYYIESIEGRLVITAGDICTHKGEVYDEVINSVYLAQDRVSIGREKFE